MENAETPLYHLSWRREGGRRAALYPGTSSPSMLPLALLDRLLASTIVPREAKLAAIERWRNELSELRAPDAFHRQLEARLAQASRSLRAPLLRSVEAVRRYWAAS